MTSRYLTAVIAAALLILTTACGSDGQTSGGTAVTAPSQAAEATDPAQAAPQAAQSTQPAAFQTEVAEESLDVCQLVTNKDVKETFNVDLGAGVADGASCEFRQTRNNLPHYVIVRVEPAAGEAEFDNLVKSMTDGGFPPEPVKGLGEEAYLIPGGLVAADGSHRVELQYVGVEGITDNHAAAKKLIQRVFDRA